MFKRFSVFVFIFVVLFLSGFAWGLSCPEDLLPGDVDGNCQVDFGDVLAVTEQWLEPAGCAGHLTDCADLIGNDGVDLRDFSVVSAHWSEGIAVINEIHYDPDVKVDLVEYVELYNPGTIAIDISGWYFSDGLNFEFGPGSTIPAGGCVVVAQDTGQVISKYGISALLVYGPFTGQLSNSGEKIELNNRRGDEIDQVDYQLGFPWPTVGDPIVVDGDGHSIQLVNPDFDNDLAGSWRSSSPSPAAVNAGVWAANIPPHIRQVEHSPKQPTSGEVEIVTCKVTDPDGVGSVTLEYQIVTPGNYIRYQYFNGSSRVQDPAFETGWVSIAMHDDGVNGDDIGGDDVYSVEIPGSVQVHRRLIRYRITVQDSGARSIKVPYADDPQPNFAYFVYDGAPAWTGADEPGVTSAVTYPAEVMNSLAIYHLISKQSEVEDCQFNPTFIEEYNWTGAMVYDGVVYDHIWYRNRGNWAVYTYGKNKWKYDFNRGHFFQARDNYGRKYKEKWDRMNYSSCVSYWHYNGNNRGESGMFEALNFKLFDLVGTPSSNTHWVHYRVIDNAVESPVDQYEGDFWGMYLVLEHPDGKFLDERNLPDGNMYKDSRNKMNQGPTHPTSSSDVGSFESGSRSGPDKAWWEANTNLEAYYGYRTIIEAVHHYDAWDDWNCVRYHHPETGQWYMIPWDVDLSWDESAYVAAGREVWDPYLDAGWPGWRKLQNNRMRGIQDLLINTEQGWELIDEYAGFISDPCGGPSFVEADRAKWDHNPRLDTTNIGLPGGDDAGDWRGYFYVNPALVTADFAGMVQKMKDYIAPSGSGGSRIASLSSDSAIPDTPTVTATCGPDYPVNGLTFETTAFSDPQGAGTFGAVQWRIAEITDPCNPKDADDAPHRYEIESVWESGDVTDPCQVDILIAASDLKVSHSYRVRCRMKDDTDRCSHWSAPIEFVTGEPLAVPIIRDLRITELMYDPTGGSDYEFI